MIAVTSFEANVAVWTIRVALACMCIFFAIRLTQRQLKDNALEIAKSLWLIGSLLSLLHAIATMAFYHQFQHSLAYEDTALQTQQAIGVAVGIGIWFNYAFVVTWLLDALWMIGFSSSYVSRHWVFNWMIYGFLGFIAFNGAIVFETGPIRWIGIAAVAILVVFWKTSNSQKSRSAQ